MISISKTIRKVLWSAIGLCLIACLVVPDLVHAQASLTLSVSPTLFDMSANPGQNWSSSVRIINSNPYDITVYVDTANFMADGESGQGRFLPKQLDSTQPNSSLAEWLTFSETTFTIPAERTVQIPFSITVPDSAAPGGHYAAILVGTQPPEQTPGQAQVKTSQVVTALVFLRVAGDVAESGVIREFRSTEWLVERPATTFELRFENTGNVHVQPQGSITITNFWGAPRGTIPVNQRTLFGNVLQNSIRQYSFEWESEWSWADIGPYTAEVTLGYGDTKRQFVTSQTTFWVLPWRIMGSIVLGVVALLWLISTLIKLYIRRVLAQAGVSPASGTVATVSVLDLASLRTEPGMLDLRKRFVSVQQERSLGVREQFVTHFITNLRYYAWGVAVLAVLITIVGVLVYGMAERAFEARLANTDTPISVSSEEDVYSDLSAARTNDGSPQFSGKVAVVNRSGVNGLAAQTRVTLETAGFAVSGLSTDIGVEEAQTVVVYDPAFEATALAVSEALGGVLLSAYVDASAERVPITVYVGKNMATE